jgi:hypothetical protein
MGCFATYQANSAVLAGLLRTPQAHFMNGLLRYLQAIRAVLADLL